MSPAKNSSAQTLLQSITAATRKTAQWTAHLLVFALTFSYHGRLGLATLRPIRQVVKSHNDPDQLKVSLGYFKARKIRELEFVRPAVSSVRQKPPSLG